MGRNCQEVWWKQPAGDCCESCQGLLVCIFTCCSFTWDGLVKIYSFLAQVSDFNGRTLSGGDMMIDPDIEACHELRCALFVIESNVLFYCELFCSEPCVLLYSGIVECFAQILIFCLLLGVGGKQRAAGPTWRTWLCRWGCLLLIIILSPFFQKWAKLDFSIS